jgi:predicted O-linked N-acetylglucosamine transferase (SPINDLY family)
VFGLHDRTNFRIFSYAHGPDDKSVERETVRRDSDTFRDVSNMRNPVNVARVIAEDQIDILVTYDGGHDFNSLEVLSLRPAPIQVRLSAYCHLLSYFGCQKLFVFPFS